METVIENATETAAAKAPRTRKASSKKTAQTVRKAKKAKAAAPAVEERERELGEPQGITINKSKRVIKPVAEKPEAKPVASKGATIQKLIGRKNGATLAEIMTATGWQSHSVRGFIATFNKKNGGVVVSSKSENGERVYKIS